jgi:outer membrane protein assembly factor BamB
LRASDASQRWQTEIGGPVSQPAILSGDAIYLVTDSDAIVAVSRADGAILWRYNRDPREGFAIAGHAGLTHVNGRLVTGFADGAVVALDASDGRVAWEVDTSLDLEEVDPARRFTDVDTTPAVAGNLVYAASFTGGLYAIDLTSGGMQLHHAELHSITGIAATEDALIISSAEQGIICLDLPGLNLRWQRRVERGNPGRAEIRGDNAYVSESRGALLALSLSDGRERGRLETAHGITAPASLEIGQGYVLSNAGTLYAFTY